MSPVRIRKETDEENQVIRPVLSCGIAVGLSLCWLTGLLVYWLLALPEHLK